jgi:hypothetical protein
VMAAGALATQAGLPGAGLASLAGDAHFAG